MITSLIKQILKRFELNQNGLAEILEVSIDRVKSLTSGRVKKLTREESELLVGKLGVRAQWLITGENPMCEDDEPQDAFVDRQRAINITGAVVDALPLTELDRSRLKVLLTGEPGHDGQLIAKALAGGLKPDEAALLDNYRHSPPEGQAAIRTTSAALAQPPCKPLKKAG